MRTTRLPPRRLVNENPDEVEDDATKPRPLLRVRDLVVRFDTEEGTITAVDGVSFDIPSRSTVALVGESGCGKSVTAHAVLRLLPTPPARIERGTIELDGQSLLTLSGRKMRRIRGRRVGIVFQDPMASLNPVLSVGTQVIEAVRMHETMRRSTARKRAIELLRRVGLPEADSRIDDYPHQLSGGMRQRVIIAIAIASNPDLLIADEPTTALDMLAEARINSLLADLKRDRDLSMLLISHDLALVAENADYIVVLYAGRVVEQGPAGPLLREPQHPYTRGLLASIPPLRSRRRRRRNTPTRLPTIKGAIPNPRDTPAGCRFAPRCPEVFDRCREEEPPLISLGDEGEVRCFLMED